MFARLFSEVFLRFCNLWCAAGLNNLSIYHKDVIWDPPFNKKCPAQTLTNCCRKSELIYTLSWSIKRCTRFLLRVFHFSQSNMYSVYWQVFSHAVFSVMRNKVKEKTFKVTKISSVSIPFLILRILYASVLFSLVTEVDCANRFILW